MASRGNCSGGCIVIHQSRGSWPDAADSYRAESIDARCDIVDHPVEADEKVLARECRAWLDAPRVGLDVVQLERLNARREEERSVYGMREKGCRGNVAPVGSGLKSVHQGCLACLQGPGSSRPLAAAST